MPRAAVGGRVLVVLPQRGAEADGDTLLADVQMGEPRHLRAPVQLVHVLLEQADLGHLPVHLEPRPVRYLFRRQRHSLGHRVTSVSIPDMRASTSKTTAKSFSSRPMPRAAVSSSFVIAVVGSGTSSSRPSSRARFMSFCIMLTSNHASSGCSRTNGPRYATIGDAITLESITSTALSRAMPLFSASRTPSLNATLCTCSCRLTALFIVTALPFAPTWKTFGPIASSTGRTRSYTSASPPTMIESLPCSSVLTLPDTGASSIAAPSSATRSASSRMPDGLCV